MVKLAVCSLAVVRFLSSPTLLVVFKVVVVCSQHCCSCSFWSCYLVVNFGYVQIALFALACIGCLPGPKKNPSVVSLVKGLKALLSGTCPITLDMLALFMLLRAGLRGDCMHHP